MKNRLNVEIYDSVFNPNIKNERIIEYKKGNSKNLYKVYIYLEGRDLPYVDFVIYKLHPTFKNNEKKVKRTSYNKNCQLIIWTWGIFTINAIVANRIHDKIRLDHRLTYDKEFSKSQVRFKAIK